MKKDENLLKEEVIQESNVEPQKVQSEEPQKESIGKKILNYLVKTTNGMAHGLFATLIIGTIIGTIGLLFSYGNNSFCKTMTNILGNSGKSGVSYVLQVLTGAGIGVGIALALEMKPLQAIVMAASGEVAAYFSLSTKFVTNNGILSDGIKVGDPLTIYFVCIAVALAMKYVLRKKTPVDVLIIPLFGILVATTASILMRYPAIYVTFGIQWLINSGTNTVPFIMGIVVAVLMGMALTAPISSAAIGAMIFTLPAGMSVVDALASSDYHGLVIASGAAIVGCCCQMVGFAIQARKDNSAGMVISIGIGTSMLEFKNILKKPIIWLPTIIASAILGPISTCWLKLACIGSNSGMGTAGLVGQIGTFISMGNTWQAWVGVFGLEIVLPAVLVFGIDLLFRKFKLYGEGDFTV